ncbi:hypothetical protein A5687_11165 [Mycobacterium mantenii]|nr:hypothetical protein A5687_11165 [Mycobacterium mantenii]
MAAMSTLTLSNEPRRMAWRVMIEKNTSTRLIQDPEVGVTCTSSDGGDGFRVPAVWDPVAIMDIENA